jgi:hypothetical protein
MAILDNLVQGLSNAAGAEDVGQRVQNKKNRATALSDDRRKASITEYMGTANNLHKSLALLLNPDTMQPMPGKEQQAAQIRQQLGQVDSHIRNLYNPNFDPDSGMTHENPLHKLGEKLHLTKPPAGNKTAGEQMAGLRDIQQKYAEMPAGKPAAASAPEAKSDEPPLARRTAPSLPGPDKPAKQYSPESVAQANAWHKWGIKPTAKYIAEAEQYMAENKLEPKEGAIHWRANGQPYQKDGKWFQAEVSPSGAMRETAMPAGFAGKLTSDQVSARKGYEDAVKLSSLADQVAANPNDAINQKRLAVSLERVSAGRFTTQALDYIIKAGWGNSLAQWANNPSTGALPSDVMRQLVDGAHQNVKASKDALDAAMGPSSQGAAKHKAGDIVMSKGRRYKVTSVRPDGKYEVEEAK